MHSSVKALLYAARLAGAFASHSQTVISGSPYSVNHDFDFIYVVVPGIAEDYNSANDEYQTAYAIFDLTNAPPASTATLFLRFDRGFFNSSDPALDKNRPVTFSLFAGDYAYPYVFMGGARNNINPGAFRVTAPLATIPLGPTPNLILGLDVSSFYNLAVAGGYGALQISAPAALGPSEAFRFDSFALAITPVPEPATYLLFLTAVVALPVIQKRRHAIAARLVR